MSIIEYDDLKLEIINKAEIEIEGIGRRKMKYYELSTGKLFISLRDFEGFMFLDKYNNFYNTIRRNIFFQDNLKFFEGDKDKEAFNLFENYNEFEKKIKDAKEEINNHEDEDKKDEIENKILDELKNKLENFDINQVILKNGKFYLYSIPSDYFYVHNENYAELFMENIKTCQYDIFQEIKDNKIDLQPYGKYTNFSENYKGEIFYNRRIGKGKFSNEENEKFFIPFLKKDELKEIENNDENIIYTDKENERLIFIVSKNEEKNFIPVTIIIKDKYNKKIIYQIEARKDKEKENNRKLYCQRF